MKKPVLAALGVAGACAACCAIPLAIPLLGGLSFAGLGWLGWETLASSPGPGLLLAGAALIAVSLVMAGVRFRRSRKNRCAPQAPAGACAVNPDKTLTGTCACAQGMA